eukprot:s1999_g1.t1
MTLLPSQRYARLTHPRFWSHISATVSRQLARIPNTIIHGAMFDHQAPWIMVGEASETVSILERECLAQDHAGSVRIADAESKAAEIKLEKNSLIRALPAERERHLLQLCQRRRELELEVHAQVYDAEQRALSEEQSLAMVHKSLSDAKGLHSIMQRQVADFSAHAKDLSWQLEQRVREAEHSGSFLADRVRSDGDCRKQSAEDFAKDEGTRIAAIAALPQLASLK